MFQGQDKSLSSPVEQQICWLLLGYSFQEAAFDMYIFNKNVKYSGIIPFNYYLIIPCNFI